MLVITIKGIELWDESAEKFTNTDDFVLELEHSLISLSKWESKYQKPFLGPLEKTSEEILDYVRLMILTKNAPEVIHFSQDNFTEINTYIESKQSATTFGQIPEQKGKPEIITSELIYYWMVGFNIPFECENWHLNRLFSLIRICNIKNTNAKPKKLSKSQLSDRNRLNAQRRSALNTAG